MLNVSLRSNISQPAFGNKFSNRSIPVSFSGNDDELNLDFTTSVSTDGGKKAPIKEKFRNFRETLGKVVHPNTAKKEESRRALNEFYNRIVYKKLIVDTKGNEKCIKPKDMGDEVNLKSVEKEVTVRAKDGSEEKFKVKVVRNTDCHFRYSLRSLIIEGSGKEKFEYNNKDRHIIYTDTNGTEHYYKIGIGTIYYSNGKKIIGEMNANEQENLKEFIRDNFADAVYPDPDNKKTGRSTPTPAKKDISDPTPKDTSSLLVDLKPGDTDFQI